MQFLKHHRSPLALAVLAALCLALVACGGAEPGAATPVAEVATQAPPATWTPLPIIIPPTNTPAPTSTTVPSATPLPASPTPEASPTAAASPTLAATATALPPTTAPTTSAPAATRVPPAAAPPTPSPNPTLGENIFPNAPFEEWVTNQNGISCLHPPNRSPIEAQCVLPGAEADEVAVNLDPVASEKEARATAHGVHASEALLVETVDVQCAARTVAQGVDVNSKGAAIKREVHDEPAVLQA